MYDFYYYLFQLSKDEIPFHTKAVKTYSQKMYHFYEHEQPKKIIMTKKVSTPYQVNKRFQFIGKR